MVGHDLTSYGWCFLLALVVAQGYASDKLCDKAQGDLQTPINLETGETGFVKGPELRMNYLPEDSGLTVINDGKVLKVFGFSSSSLKYRTTTYQLEEIRFRKQSETRFDGKAFLFEAHLIHRHAKRGVIAVAVLFQPGPKSNTFLDALNWGSGELKVSGGRNTISSANPATILPDQVAYYTYMGLQPCEERWRWITFMHKSTITNLELSSFPFQGNSRGISRQANRKVGMVYNKRFIGDAKATESPLSSARSPRSSNRKGCAKSKYGCCGDERMAKKSADDKCVSKEDVDHRQAVFKKIRDEQSKLRSKTLRDRAFSGQVKEALLPALVAAHIISGEEDARWKGMAVDRAAKHLAHSKLRVAQISDKRVQVALLNALKIAEGDNAAARKVVASTMVWHQEAANAGTQAYQAAIKSGASTVAAGYAAQAAVAASHAGASRKKSSMAAAASAVVFTATAKSGNSIAVAKVAAKAAGQLGSTGARRAIYVKAGAAAAKAYKVAISARKPVQAAEKAAEEAGEAAGEAARVLEQAASKKRTTARKPKQKT